MIQTISAGKLFRVIVAVLPAVALAACNQGETSTTAATDSSMAAVSPQAMSAAAASSGGATTAPADPFSFSAATYSVAQDQGSVTLLVQRTGSAGSAVSVGYASANGTAIAGTDYAKTSGSPARPLPGRISLRRAAFFSGRAAMAPQRRFPYPLPLPRASPARGCFTSVCRTPGRGHLWGRRATPW